MKPFPAPPPLEFKTLGASRTSPPRSASALAALALLISGTAARGYSFVDPDAALGIWDFNNPSAVSQSADSIHGTPVTFLAGTAFSADAAGRSGQTGDRAMNFGTTAGNSAKITNAAFMALLNQSNSRNDRLTVVFWQKWSANIANSSSIWCNSASAAGNRGLQAHVPYGDGTVFFDTSGCCTIPAQRLQSGTGTVLPGFNWQQWHHFALVKDGAAKQIWIDGQLLASQTTGVSALLGDWTEILLGQQLGAANNTVRGLMDDLAIFGTALDSAQIAALAGGLPPADLVVPPENRPPAISNLSPADGAVFQPTNTSIGFTATTVSPNTIATDGIRLYLNGTEATSGLVITGTPTDRAVSYTGTLQTNQFYNLRAVVSDGSGRISTRTWTFDTADPNTVPNHPALDLPSVGGATLSSGGSANPAIDGNPATVAETANQAGSFIEYELERSTRISRIHLVSPADPAYAGTLEGVVVKVYDLRDQVVYQTTIGPVAPGDTWAAFLPPGTDGRIVRLELPAGQTNGAGDYRIALAELKILGDPAPDLGPLVNYALGTEAYMVRLTDTLPPPSNANDGNLETYIETTTQTVDGYWETDLGTTRSLYLVRAVAFDSTDHQQRLRHATLRLFDENHESVYSKHLSGTSQVFDIALPGPVSARYVRIGFEDKERSSATGGIEWWLRLREVEAYGRPAGETGLTGFAASSTAISAGQSATLTWQEKDLRDLKLYPAIGSVGAHTAADGSGAITVSPATTTEYLLIGSNHNGQVARFVTIQVDGQALPPRISEVVAANKLSFRDGYREASDWIELHNPNNTPLDLTGHWLGDDPGNPMKWRFPAGTTIAPHGYLIVFASNRNSGMDSDGFLHANFSLNASGESVVLTAADGTTVLDSIVNYPAQQDDLAWGRTPDGITGFLSPTPQAVNAPAPLAGWLAPPVFSHSRGFYDQPFTLTLTQPDPAAQLWVSLNGSEPDTPYSGPIQVTGSMTVRAAVRRDGFLPPRTVTHTYLFRDSVMTSPLMNTTYTQGALASRLRDSLTQLPTICVSTPKLPDDRKELEASMEIFMPDGTPSIQLNAGFNRVGGAWTEFAKKSYRLKFRPEFGARRLEFPLFRGFDRGVPALERVNTLDLTAGNHDMVARGFYMANRFVEDTMLEMGSLNPHGRYVHLYVNGTYWGQYNAHERLDDSFLADYLGGQTEDYVTVLGNDNVGDSFIPGTPEPPNRQLWETTRASRGSYAAAKDSLDVSQLIDFMLVWFYGNSESEYRCAGPVAPGTGFKFWLADADGFLRTSALTLDRTANAGPGGLFGALVAEGHPDFKTLLADRIYKHFFNNGALTPERNLARLNARMDEIRDSLIAECARWGYRTPTNWEDAAQTIRTGLFPQRTSNLFTMLRNRNLYPAVDPPVLGQHGGSVTEGFNLTLNSGAGTIHYTLDGSDPRLPGGGISPTAQSASVTQNTHVAIGSQWRFWDRGSLPATNWHTPAYNDTSWSAGTAPLGYGSGNEATVISYGTNAQNKYRTSYFRKSFTVANPAAITSLTLGLVRDDGAVVYLNGTEIVRSNMPAGTITYDTAAASTVSGNDKYTVFNFTVPQNLVVAGSNVLAVEVHQINASSSDLRFDLSLTDSALPSLTLNQNTNFKSRLLSGGTWSALSEAVFHVAHPLIAAGPYVLDQWSGSAAPGTYPQAMRFFQTDTPDPVLETPMDAPWTLPYNLTSRSRINGLAAEGISFVNTGSVQNTTGAGFVGAAVLALDTRGAQDIRVTWTGGTVAPNVRDQGIRLQYRVGGSGDYLDVPDAGGNPVEYLRNAVAGHSSVIGPVTLPQTVEGQPLVELRWKYYFRSGTSDARAQLRLDDIQVTAGPVLAESLAMTRQPSSGQAGAVTGPFSVQVRGRNDAVAENFSGMVTVGITGQPGPLGGTTTRQAVNGNVVFDDLVFPQAGVFTLTATASGLSPATSSPATRIVGLTEIVTPRFIQGRTPENHQRVPFACLVRMDGLLPNAVYRYANQIVNEDDSPTLEGAGNMIFTGTPGAGFTRSTESPRFLPGDLNLRHGEFTSDATGSHTRWFITEPSGNIRFSAGNTVRVRILLNDGNSGDLAVHHLTGSAPVVVLPFGTGANEGSALYAQSAAAPRNLVVLYEETTAGNRPLAATFVEASGAAVDAAYAPFYQTMVAGRGGRWGTIIPNNLTSGVRLVEERDLWSGNVVSTFTSPAGHLPTSGLANGADPVGISVPDSAAGGFALWQARLFTLAEIADPAVGAVTGDPDSDGTSNLLEYAFGMNPLANSGDGLPAAGVELFEGAPHLVFRYRRLTGDPQLIYQEMVSDDARLWQDAAGAWNGSVETSPNPDGITETVTRRLPVDPGSPRRFLRVRVQSP